MDGTEDRRHRTDREAHAVESEEYESRKGVARLDGIVGHLGENLHGHGHGFVGGLLGVCEHDGHEGVDLPPAVLGIVVDRYQTLADHLVEMDGEGGLRLACDLREFGEGQIPLLELVEDLPPDIV